MRSAQAWQVVVVGIALLISLGCRTPPKTAQKFPVVQEAVAVAPGTPQGAPRPVIPDATPVEPITSISQPDTDTREPARGHNSKQKTHFESRPQSLPIRLQIPGRASLADRPAPNSPPTKLSAPGASFTRNPAPSLTLAPAGQSELSAASLPNPVPVPAPTASTPSAKFTPANPIRIGSLVEKSGDDSDWREWQLVRQRTLEQVRHAEREKLLHNLTNLLQRAGQ
jgi:hypothetical protein